MLFKVSMEKFASVNWKEEGCRKGDRFVERQQFINSYYISKFYFVFLNKLSKIFLFDFKIYKIKNKSKLYIMLEVI